MPQKLRIAIDTSYMDRRPGKGTAIVIRHTVEELLGHRDEFDITLVHKERIPEDPVYREFNEIVIPRVRLPKFSGFFSELLFFLKTKERFDIYYFSYSRLYPTFWLAPARRIIWAAMDGGPRTAGYRGKAKGKAPWYVRMFLGHVDAFVALSEFGKRGIVDTYHVPSEKVTVIYNGVDERFRANVEADAGTLARYGLPASYLLSVSRFDPHKNILRLLEAYAKTRAEDCTEPLVFVGGRHMPDYSLEIDRTIERLALTNSVIIAPYIADEDMPKVYACATALLFPSLYEGFGLPVVEAQSVGTPVLVSNIDALTEISGGHAVVVDPYDADAIAAGIKEILDSRTRMRLSDSGKAWATRFTWRTHADALAALLKKVGGSA